MSPEVTFDASIPVLTEVLSAEPTSLALSSAVELASAPADAGSPVPSRTELAAALEADAIVHWDDGAWAMLEHRLSERIMRQLQSRVDFVLEQRIKDCMADVLSHALHGLTNDIRVGLHDTIEKIVSRAVAQELTHLQAQRPH